MPAILLCGFRRGGDQLDARIKRAAQVFHNSDCPKRIYYLSSDKDDGAWRGDMVRERFQHLGLLPKHLHFASLANNTREEVRHFLNIATEDGYDAVSSGYHRLRLWRIFEEHGVSATIHTTHEGTWPRDFVREAAAWFKHGLTAGLAH
jgi:hypothetical protein